MINGKHGARWLVACWYSGARHPAGPFSLVAIPPCRYGTVKTFFTHQTKGLKMLVGFISDGTESLLVVKDEDIRKNRKSRREGTTNRSCEGQFGDSDDGIMDGISVAQFKSKQATCLK